MPMQPSPEVRVDPRRYFESVDARRNKHAAQQPVCVYLETTNRCNLLCTTCPRTYAELEPPADMSWKLFTSIVDQIPNLQRAVLHGVGEPMLVRNLPRMVRYLKDRGTYVLFNTNGTLLNERNGRALIEAGLDELRVSLDASNAKSFWPFAARITSAVFSGTSVPSAICRNAKGRISRVCRLGSPGSRKRLLSCQPSCTWPRKSACARFICSAWCFSAATPSASPGPTRRSPSG